MSRTLLTVCLAGLAAGFTVGLRADSGCAAEPNLEFQVAEPTGYFAFDTGQLRGRLRLDGKSQGVPEMVHVASGVEVTYGGGHVGLLSHYRVFSTDTRYGHAARDWPSQPKLLDDGSVEVLFPPGDDHPLTMIARFRFAAADTLDVETIVTPEVDMPRFEVFLSNYFAKEFSASVYVKPNRFAKKDPPSFLAADHNPLLDGNYLMFPRDREAVLRIFDRRWDFPPSPVQWAVNRYMAAPLAMRRHEPSGVTALVMAPPDDCFAIATPYNKTPPDGVAGHSSLYLSLFGNDVAAGQTVRAHSRLVVAQNLSDRQAENRYEAYLAERAP